MKKFLFVCLSSAALLSLSSCSSGFFDPLTLKFNIETEPQILTAKAMKASDPEIVKNYDIDVVQALKDKGVTTMSQLSSFYVDAVSISFNKDICEKLQSYETSITFPTTPTPETVKTTKTTNDCSSLNRDPLSQLSMPIVIDASSTNEQYKRLLATDWAPYLKNGGKLSVSIKLKAGADYDKAVGANASLKAHGQFGL